LARSSDSSTSNRSLSTHAPSSPPPTLALAAPPEPHHLGASGSRALSLPLSVHSLDSNLSSSEGSDAENATVSRRRRRPSYREQNDYLLQAKRQRSGEGPPPPPLPIALPLRLPPALAAEKPSEKKE